MLTPEEKKSIIDYRRQKAYNNLNEAREVSNFIFGTYQEIVPIMLHFIWRLHCCWIRVYQLKVMED